MKPSKSPELGWLVAQPIAHRGFHDQNKNIWENTLPAFERAINAGFAIECDVRLSADGVPMIFHDGDLTRLCDRDETIEGLNATELETIKIGSTEAVIPRFSTLLQVCAGRVPLIVELKSATNADKRFAPTMLDAITHFQKSLALMSFDALLLRQLKEAGAVCPLGLTAEGTTDEDFERHRVTLAMGIDFISYYYDHLTNPFISDLRESGTPIITWTVRDERARNITRQYADQMTFEGFDPRN